MLSVCLWIPPSHINFWMPEHIFMKLGVYIYNVAWAHLNGILHKSLPSVRVSVCVSILSLLGKGPVKYVPPFIARQRLGKHVPARTNTCNNRRSLGRVCLWVCLYNLVSLLGNNSVNTFPWQRRFFEASFSMRSVLYQRKVCDYFFPELRFTITQATTLVSFIQPNNVIGLTRRSLSRHNFELISIVLIV
jgi:hypothetical protein